MLSSYLEARQGAEPSANRTPGDDTLHKVKGNPRVSGAEDTRYGPDRRSLVTSGGITPVVEQSLDQDPEVRFLIFISLCTFPHDH